MNWQEKLKKIGYNESNLDRWVLKESKWKVEDLEEFNLLIEDFRKNKIVTIKDSIKFLVYNTEVPIFYIEDNVKDTIRKNKLLNNKNITKRRFWEIRNLERYYDELEYNYNEQLKNYYELSFLDSVRMLLNEETKNHSRIKYLDVNDFLKRSNIQHNKGTFYYDIYWKEIKSKYNWVNNISEAKYCFINNVSKPQCKECSSDNISYLSNKYQTFCSRACQLKYNNKEKELKFNKDISIKEIYNLIITTSKDSLNSCNEKIADIGLNIIDYINNEYETCTFSSKLKLFVLYYENGKDFDLKNNRIKIDNRFSAQTSIIFYKDLGFKEQEYYVRNKSEKEISLLINNSSINDRKIISPLELDVYSEERKLAIEYDGIMYHSFGKSKHSKFNNTNEDNTYHLKKTELCEDKNIQLYHIFENEWINKTKKDIWISKINGKQQKHNRLFARKCIIKEINTKEATDFLAENHLQGYGNSSIKIGMFYNKDLVSVMTIGTSRFSKKYQYELIRLATKKDLTIVGGASKLLKYFERKYNPESLVSYANRRWSTGNVYEKLGFEFSHNSAPNYFYFAKGSTVLESRNKYQKHKLEKILDSFDNELTETENMYNNNYRKIFDCGNKVYYKKY